MNEDLELKVKVGLVYEFEGIDTILGFLEEATKTKKRKKIKFDEEIGKILYKQYVLSLLLQTKKIESNKKDLIKIAEKYKEIAEKLKELSKGDELNAR